MKKSLLTILIVGLFALGAQAGPIPAPTLTLLPSSGTVTGSPGGMVGWGFTVTYTSPSDWILLTGSQFDPTNLLGSDAAPSYTDFVGSQFVVVGPSPESSTVSQSYNAVAQTGLGEITIPGYANPGDFATGNLVLHYSVFSVDPNNPNWDPSVDTVVADATVSASTQANVVAAEPGSLAMLLGAAPLLLGTVRRKLWR